MTRSCHLGPNRSVLGSNHGSLAPRTDPRPTEADEIPGSVSLAIDVRQITKVFGDQTVVDAVDLAVPEHSVYCLLGPNGAGKTTLIRILTTLLQATSGTALVAGIDVAADPKGVRSHIGLAGQFAAVDAHLTGRENLVMVGRLYNLTKAEAERRTDEVLARIGLSGDAGKRAGAYSGGMKRRLDLAASMVGRPSILFLDEPTTGVDPRSRIGIWELIEELVSEGTTLMLTTQYLDEAERLADRIGVIDHGRLIAEGTADQLKDQMGGDRVELTVATADVARARDVMSGVHHLVTTVEREGRLTVAAPNGAADLMSVMRGLEAASITPVDIGLRRPSLDDVFLSLTDPDNPPAATANEEQAR